MPDSEKFDLLAHSDSSTVTTKRKRFCCPHCDTELILPVAIVLEHPILATHSAEAIAKDWRLQLTPDEESALAAAERAGWMKPFAAAVEARRLEPVRNVDRFFLTWLKTANRKQIAGVALDHFKATHGGFIEVWAAQGVAAVLSDRTIREFCPTSLTVGEGIKSLRTGAIKARADVDETALVAWTRTRFGYVPSDCRAFLDEIRRKSFGEFADVRL